MAAAQTQRSTRPTFRRASADVRYRLSCHPTLHLTADGRQASSQREASEGFSYDATHGHTRLASPCLGAVRVHVWAPMRAACGCWHGTCRADMKTAAV
jgi:hypothetical protein